MASLGEHLEYLQAQYEAAEEAPLSTRKAMLVAMLVDAYADRLFAAEPGSDDILAFRASLSAASPALRLVLDLCALRQERPRLVTEAVEVPIPEYDRLPVEDFMVSLYDAHTVQRVRIVLPDGDRRDVHEILAQAIEDLRQRSRY